jgi:hypothetical protein
LKRDGRPSVDLSRRALIDTCFVSDTATTALRIDLVSAFQVSPLREAAQRGRVSAEEMLRTFEWTAGS